MPVTRVTRSLKSTTSQDENGRKLREVYNVHLGDNDERDILLAYEAVDPDDADMAVPAFGDPYRNDDTMEVVLVTPEWADGQGKAPLIYVAVDYSNKNEQEQKPDGGGVWNVEINGSGQELIERTNRDADGNPIKNTFGDVYAADFEVVRYDELITVTFNTDKVSYIRPLKRSRGRVNDSTIKLKITRFGQLYEETYKPHTLKLGNATWKVSVGADGLGYWNITIPLLYRYQEDKDGAEIGWKIQIPDRGCRAKPPTGGGSVPYPCVDLDGKGKKLADGQLQNLLVKKMLYTADFMAFLEGIGE